MFFEIHHEGTEQIYWSDENVIVILKGIIDLIENFVTDILSIYS